jgi:hypothetical protein
MAKSNYFVTLEKRRRGGALAFACALLIALLAGCAQGGGSDGKDGKDDETPETPATPKTYKVYVSGSRFVINGEDDAKEYPCYWDGATRVDLAGDADGMGRALAIAASGGSIYVAGNIGLDPSGGDNFRSACYWKDGARTAIPGHEAVGILVGGGTVYAAVNGEWENVLIDGLLSNVYTAAYVAGGAASALPGAEKIEGTSPQRYQETKAYGIALSGGTVSTIGVGWISGGTKPCRWDGTTLHQYSGQGRALGICASGSSIYAAGCYFSSPDASHKPCYWNGDTLTELPVKAGDDGAQAQCIKVVGGLVYTAGYRYTGDDYLGTGTRSPCYWIGTTRTDLPTGGSSYGEVSGIEVGEGVVYAAGYYFDGTKTVPCYWKGETRVDLPANGDTYATGIALIEE